MTRIRRNTSARHQRNINRGKQRAIIAAYNPAYIYMSLQVLDILF